MLLEGVSTEGHTQAPRAIRHVRGLYVCNGDPPQGFISVSVSR